MSSKRTTDDAFDALHGIVADALIEQITAWKENRLVDFKLVKDGDEFTTYVQVLPPALIAQAIKFLKDNGIDSPAQSGSKTDTLKDAMPDFGDADNVVAIRR